MHILGSAAAALFVAFALTVAGAPAGMARSLGASDGPAEVPPASYKGNQYVDSRGCVFVRAGVGGAVNWVPRVTRSRQLVCGYAPTLAAAAPPPAKPSPAGPPAAKTASGDAVAATPAPAPPAAKPPAAKERARRVGPPIRTIATKTTPPRIRPAHPAAPAAAAGPAAPQIAPVAAPAAPRVAVPAAAPPPTAAQIEAARRAACPQLDATASRYMIRVNGFPVRCAPQAEVPGGQSYDARTTVSVDGSGVAPGTAAPAGAVPAPPPGYKAAWEDDRLNPGRGARTEAGDRQMAEVFTPGVVPMVESGSPGSRTAGEKSAVPAAGAGNAWVQVGAFGVPSNATAAVARLRAAGLPVGLAPARKAGKPLQVVLAGPFASSADLAAGLAQARRAGFGDAFARR